MRLIIAGPRDFDRTKVDASVAAGVESFCVHAGILPGQISEVVSGHSGNVDLAGERWAEANGVPMKPFPYLSAAALAARGIKAKDPRRAGGPVRNGDMAHYAAEAGPGAGGCLLVRDGRPGTAGTDSMLLAARAANLVILNWRGPVGARERAMAYAMAWKKGAAGSAKPVEWSESVLARQFAQAYEDGRKAVGAAYQAELDRLGVTPVEAQRWLLRG